MVPGGFPRSPELCLTPSHPFCAISVCAISFQTGLKAEKAVKPLLETLAWTFGPNSIRQLQSKEAPTIKRPCHRRKICPRSSRQIQMTMSLKLPQKTRQKMNRQFQFLAVAVSHGLIDPDQVEKVKVHLASLAIYCPTALSCQPFGWNNRNPILPTADRQTL